LDIAVAPLATTATSPAAPGSGPVNVCVIAALVPATVAPPSARHSHPHATRTASEATVADALPGGVAVTRHAARRLRSPATGR
jgi:hypothetical protein